MSCPLCFSPISQDYLPREGLKRCECGLYYWNIPPEPLLNSSKIEDYMKEARPGLFEKVKGHVREGRVLDYGGGTGCWSAPLREHGFDVYLLDPDRTLVEYGVRKWGLKGVSCFIGDAPYIEGYFDLIVMNQVIEHVRHPNYEVAMARHVVRDGGWLMVRTGATSENPDWGPDFHYLKISEYTFWTLKHLKMLMERNSFIVVEGKLDTEQGFNLEVWGRK